ncbi:MAG: hypothetical protein K6A77_05685 [Clostridiales bacterium]|nr:hypothetical protein [Clostridiales bacterium]
MEFKKKFSAFSYRIIKALIWFFSPKFKVEGVENLPEGACIIVGNHSQLYGPIACELYSPRPRRTWCAGEMMHWDEVAPYAFQDFWSQKPKWTHPWFRLMSHLIKPLSVCLFTNAETIEVYHDTRLINTIRQTISTLTEGSDIVIFPEKDAPGNHILYAFQDKFVDVARFYYRKTHQQLSFVPLYIAPHLKTMYYGTPIAFDPSTPIDEERAHIIQYLRDEITHTAESLPLHTVVPYRNIPKKLYPKNK